MKSGLEVGAKDGHVVVNFYGDPGFHIMVTPTDARLIAVQLIHWAEAAENQLAPEEIGNGQGQPDGETG